VEGLAPGEWRHLEAREVVLLKKEAAASVRDNAPGARPASARPHAKKVLRRVVVRKPRVRA
jgi:hypothetical protein